MTFDQAANIVGQAPKAPTNAQKLTRAFNDFCDEATYRMEAGHDARALEVLGATIGQALRQANLSDRANCNVTKTYWNVAESAAVKPADLIDALCDNMGPGSEIVRYAALKAMEE